MPKLRFWEKSVLVISVGLAVLMLVSGLGAALTISQGSAAHPPSFLKRDSLWGGWAAKGAVGSVLGAVGSWIQPAQFTCPTPASTVVVTPYASEAIGVGLNYLKGRMDGVGTLGFCVGATVFYAAWYDEAPAPAVLIPTALITPAPGNIFNASVSCNAATCFYFLEDQTTAQTYSLTWSHGALPFNLAECVVMKGTALGVLPAAFAPLPASAHLPGNTMFGSLFTGIAGCEVIINAVPFGFGAVPTPSWTPVRFTLSAVPVITPTPAVLPLLTGLAPQDSFTVA